MITRLPLFALAMLLSAFVAAETKSAEGGDRVTAKMLQGNWVRAGHPSRFVIRGTKLTAFKVDRPTVASNTGVLSFPKNKPYAFVDCSNGGKFYLYPVAANILALETINPDGTVYGDGRIFYKDGEEAATLRSRP